MNFANLAKAEWVDSDLSGIILRWGDVLLKAETGPKSPPEGRIYWTIRTTDVLLVKDGRPNESSLGIILSADVTEIIGMGSSVLVSVIVARSGGVTATSRWRTSSPQCV